MVNVESRMSEPVSRANVEERFRQFALRVIRLVDVMPGTVAGREIGRQVLRSATSAAANYRAAGHGKSKADFIAKLGVAEEEIDETCFWLSVISDADLIAATRLTELRQEAEELTRIVASSIRTARGEKQRD
jgi:four helix bundle protein